MAYKVVTAVATEPVTLAEARLQCKVDSDDTTHDTALTTLITEAREYAEHYTGLALAPQTLEMALDCFPDYEDDVIALEMPPVATITSVKYTDLAGVEQTITSTAYSLSLYGSSRNLSPTYNNYWPSTQDIPDAVRIRYATGYSTAPKAAKGAMLIHIELSSPLNPLTPAERATMERARDSLLNTIKAWGRG
jgi:uncharacterized phiE125 gp8 family phage protein